MSEYKERDAMQLDEAGNYYGKHVVAMTSESLHSKSDIAAELGYRDMVIDTITKQRDDLLKCLETVNSHAVYRAGTFNNGETVAQYAARVISTIKEQKDAE